MFRFLRYNFFFSKTTHIVLLFITFINLSDAQDNHTISGYVYENESKESLPGANIYCPKLKRGTTTNSYGFYSINLPKDSIEITISYVGFKSKSIVLNLEHDVQKDFNLEVNSLDEVAVIAENQDMIYEKTQMSSIELSTDQIKKIPALLGERDVLKVIQLLPGVQKGSEGSTGIYIRGGGPDQNLIILDEAPVYNANHLFGFFSVFNGDALKSVELFKGGFPARYGGRLSSVIDLQMKDGNKNKFHGEGGIGIVSSRFTIEGPIIKEKCSFLVSGRRTYLDALIYPFLPKTSKGGYYFYDLNAKVNYEINQKNKVYLSSYFGKDKFYLKLKNTNNESNAGLDWGNATATLRWNHLFSSRLFSNISIIYTNYQMGISSFQNNGVYFYKLNYDSKIRDLGLKYNFDYIPFPDHYLKFGFYGIWHHFTPEALVISSSNTYSNKKDDNVGISTYESGLFLEDDWKISNKIKMNLGMRFSTYSDGKTNYFLPEPRASVRFLLKENFSIKGSYALMNQYLHLLSNTGIGLPTDLWVPSVRNIKPQQSQQLAIGLVQGLAKNKMVLTIEGYYKWMDHILNYKEGASFLKISDNSNSDDQDNWQNKVVSGNGISYGTEVLIQKTVGKFTGWIGYTISWAYLKFDSLNNGNTFPARYDRRHDVSIVGIYNINDRITISSTWVYGSGNAITLPISTYAIEPNNPISSSLSQNPNVINIVNEYSQKNSFRMAANHRLDIGIQFHKKLKNGVRTLELSLYNAYNRKNPYYYYTEFDQNTNKHKLMQLSLFPIIPSISYSFKF